MRQIGKDLGVSGQTLRNWVRQANVDAGTANGVTTGERTRVRHNRGCETASSCRAAV